MTTTYPHPDHVYQPEASALPPLSQPIAAQSTMGNSKFVLLVELAKSNCSRTLRVHIDSFRGLYADYMGCLKNQNEQHLKRLFYELQINFVENSQCCMIWL